MEKGIKEFMTDFFPDENFPFCSCSEKYVEIINEEFEHMKREYFIYDVEFICMNCEQSWIKRFNLKCYYDEFKLTQLPTGDEEE